MMHFIGAGSLVKMIDMQEADAIGREIQHELKKSHHSPLMADIRVVDAAEQMNVLYNMKFSEDAAAEVIIQSRRGYDGGHDAGPGADNVQGIAAPGSPRPPLALEP